MEAIYSVPQTKNRQEILERGTPLFPCSIYDRDVRQYITGEIPPHWHHEMELFFLIEGHAHITLADAGFDLEPGEGCFVNSNTLHGVFCPFDNICHYHSIVFDPCILSGFPGSAYDLLYIRPFIEQGSPVCIFRPNDHLHGSEISEFFQTAFAACESEAHGYEFEVHYALSHILLLLKEQSQKTTIRQSRTQELRMKQMLSWLDEHYMEQVTVSQLADAVGICVRECQKTFSNTLHTTPMKYLNRRRIAVAAEFLVSNDMPVSEIGVCCGFDSPSYFTKQFKALTGITPKEYRRENCSGNKEF